jgi:fumarate hydratase subunit beta
MKHLKVPLDRAAVESLKLGEVIELSGTVHTLRDEAHKEALEIHHRSEPLPFDLANGVVFHCGPIMKRKGDEWELVAAGPTTSTRMNDLEPEFIKAFGVRAIIGKGGMSQPTVEAMKREGCVYLSTTGGAAVLAARGISAVHGVHWLGLGMPEAVWVFEMNHFGPLIVSIDAHGNSLYDRVDADVRESLTNIKKRIGI